MNTYYMDYIVCIPSYKRAKICNNRTLNTLRSIDPSKIYVYVADEAEYDIYKSILDPTTYNELRIGIKGLVQQRQFISKQWPLHQHIVYLDDDIESIDISISPFKNLDEFIKHAFSECVKQKSYLWGVYPVYNVFFRKARAELVTGLNYIVGAFYGIINRPTYKGIQLTITAENSQKEDVERTIKYFLSDGIVLRFNKIGFKTKYYGKEGGLGNFKERLEPMREAAEKLKEVYPEYGNIKTRKNGMTEFVLKKVTIP